MKTITLTFKKKVEGAKDALGNPIFTTQDVKVEGCLIAPITEPTNDRETQAMAQGRKQVRIHLPKTFTGDVSNSTVNWNGDNWRIDSDNVSFMAENCPTNWNRYFRGEAIYE